MPEVFPRVEGITEVRRVTKNKAVGGWQFSPLTGGTQEMLNSVFLKTKETRSRKVKRKG